MSNDPRQPKSSDRTDWGDPSAASWLALLLVSVATHGALAGGLYFVGPSPEDRERRKMIELRQAKKKEPPKPAEAKEPPKPKKKPPPKRKLPRKLAMKQQPIKKVEPKPEPKLVEPSQKPGGEPSTGPKVFGLPDMKATATPGSGGVAVPKGDSLEVSPKVRKRGPKKEKGFKKEYQKGEQAPLAVITTKPKPAKKVQPVYPQRMQDLGIEGRVVLELTVDEKGRVIEATVLRGLHPELDRAAIAAAKKMTFQPGKVNGTPVKIKIPYSFVFVLD